MASQDYPIGEGTALLGNSISHHENSTTETTSSQNFLCSPATETSADVIERTNLLFHPDFRRNDNDDLGSSLGGGGRRNRIAILNSVARRRRNPNNSSSKHQTILEECGIAEISTDSSLRRFTNAMTMIGTITTSGILNLSLARPSGLGMVILPGAFAKVGYVEGTLLFLAVGLCSATSLVVLNEISETIDDCDRENGNSSENNHDHDAPTIPNEVTASYECLVFRSLGRLGSLVLEVSILLNCLGQLVAYLGFIHEQFAFFFAMVGIRQSAIVARLDWIVGLGIILPLSLLPQETSKIRFAGILGTFCAIYILLVVVFQDGLSAYLTQNGFCSLSPEAGNWAFSGSNIFQALPLFLFFANTSVGYVPVRYQHRTCLGQLLSLVTNWSGYRPTTAKILQQESSSLIWTSVIMIGEIYLFGSLVAYAAYCEGVPENLLNLWPGISGFLARLVLVMELVVCSAGIGIPMGRAALWRLLVCGGTCCRERPDGFLVQLKTVVTTLCLVASAVVGSQLVKGAVVLPLAVTGAVCGTAQIFVLPGLSALVLHLASRTRTTTVTTFSYWYKAVLFFGFGIPLGMAVGVWSLLALLGEVQQ